MRKSTIQFLEQNGFVHHTNECIEYDPKASHGSWVSYYNEVYAKQYKYFQAIFYLVPHYDKRFPPHKKRGYIFSSYSPKQEQMNSYIYNDCVYFKMRNIELDYSKQITNVDAYHNPLTTLTNNMNTFQGILKMRQLHKKLCPTKFKGNWKNMSIPQLQKLLTEFDNYDRALEKAIKESAVYKKLNEIDKDF